MGDALRTDVATIVCILWLACVFTVVIVNGYLSRFAFDQRSTRRYTWNVFWFCSGIYGTVIFNLLNS